MENNSNPNNMYSTDVIQLMLASIDKLAQSHDKTNDKVDKLIEAMSKQEVILEKIANVEKSHRDSTNRVHARIDDSTKRIDSLEAKCEENSSTIARREQAYTRLRDVEEKVEKMDFVLVLSKYPKLVVVIGAMLYIFAIKDVRDLLLQFMGML